MVLHGEATSSTPNHRVKTLLNWRLPSNLLTNGWKKSGMMSAMKLHEISGRSKVGSLRCLSLKMFLHFLVSSLVLSKKTIFVVLAIQTPSSCSFAHLLIMIPTTQMLLFEASNLLPKKHSSHSNSLKQVNKAWYHSRLLILKSSCL